MNSRYLAGVSLAIMAAGFAVTLMLPDHAAIVLLRGGFEAGLVGGVADWFAVTALFRHPFGIPIPHTSLLLKNKHRIVQSLISSVENELLNQESIGNKLKSMKPFRLANGYLFGMLRKRSFRVRAIDALSDVVRRLPLEDAADPIRKTLASFVRDFDAGKVVRSVVHKAKENQYDEKALDYALAKATEWAERPETVYMLGKFANERLTAAKMGGFMGFAVQAFAGFMSEDKLGGILQSMLLTGFRDLGERDNEYRMMLIGEIRSQMDLFANDEEKLTALKERIAGGLLSDDGLRLVSGSLESLRQFVLGKLAEGRESGGRFLFAGYRALVRRYERSPETADEWEGRLLNFLADWVRNNHYRIGQLIQENVDRMDDKALVDMLEDKVGKDLQWIRVNGALCGFVVGLVLTLIELAI